MKSLIANFEIYCLSAYFDDDDDDDDGKESLFSLIRGFLINGLKSISSDPINLFDQSIQ